MLTLSPGDHVLCQGAVSIDHGGSSCRQTIAHPYAFGFESVSGGSESD